MAEVTPHNRLAETIFDCLVADAEDALRMKAKLANRPHGANNFMSEKEFMKVPRSKDVVSHKTEHNAVSEAISACVTIAVECRNDIRRASNRMVDESRAKATSIIEIDLLARRYTTEPMKLSHIIFLSTIWCCNALCTVIVNN
jgi:hypothetical protein